MPEHWNRREFVTAVAAGLVASDPFHADAAAAPQQPDSSGAPLPARLGYPADARLLIVNLDDLGLLHSVDAAAFDIFEKGVIASGSLMPPCPWFPEAADFARTHPALDLGLHFTFTSERPGYRWGPVLGPSAVPSLVDADGCFPTTWDNTRHVNLAELGAEMRAQFDRALRFGFAPTHLDSHEHCLQWHGEAVFALLIQLAQEHKLPVRVGRNWVPEHPYLVNIIRRGGVVLNRTITVPADTAPERWTPWYAETIRTIGPGVTELFAHPAYDDGEMRAFSPTRFSYGSAWRQRDYDALTSPEVQGALTTSGVKLIRWTDLGSLVSGS